MKTYVLEKFFRGTKPEVIQNDSISDLFISQLPQIIDEYTDSYAFIQSFLNEYNFLTGSRWKLAYMPKDCEVCVYNQTNINLYQYKLRMSRYSHALEVWRNMGLTPRENVLKQVNASSVFAHRSLPFLPANVRESIIDNLNKGR